MLWTKEDELRLESDVIDEMLFDGVENINYKKEVLESYDEFCDTFYEEFQIFE